MDLDIDDLLSEDFRVPLASQPTNGSLEYILGLGDDEELPEEVEVPLWICDTLRRGTDIKPGEPVQLNARMQGRLKAQAWSVKLREENFYYYECALKLAHMHRTSNLNPTGLGGKQFLTVLRKALAARYHYILPAALNSRGQDMSAFLDGELLGWSINALLTSEPHSPTCALALTRVSGWSSG